MSSSDGFSRALSRPPIPGNMQALQGSQTVRVARPAARSARQVRAQAAPAKAAVPAVSEDLIFKRHVARARKPSRAVARGLPAVRGGAH